MHAQVILQEDKTVYLMFIQFLFLVLFNYQL